MSNKGSNQGAGKGQAKQVSGPRAARSRARSCVMQAIYQWQLTSHDAAAIDPQFLIDETEGEVDRRFFDVLLREALTYIDDLDEQIEPLLDRPLHEVDPVERAILRLGACELRYHPETPYRVIINEGVELAKLFGAHHGHKYVNGILDRLAERMRREEVALVSSNKGAK
ncbi:MAG: transcription antitermination factor NusB [Chromatiales bacterium]|jgi:N utilization substance protein B|nr:transcription antitermination factor NusB [Chromatiales bacterium]